MLDQAIYSSTQPLTSSAAIPETAGQRRIVSGSPRDRYAAFCAMEPTVSILSQPWWLDAVCGEAGWDVSLVENGGRVVGALPFRRSRRLTFDLIHMPAFTQNLKLWIGYTDSKKSEARLSQEKEVIAALISGLPHFDYFHLQFHHTLKNWLPFYWQGFAQTTMYTYVIEDLSDIEKVCSRFSHAKRKNLKRAEGDLSLGPELSAEEFYAHHKRTLAESGDQISYAQSLLARIHEATYARGCGKVFTAIDKANHIHAAILVVWDCEQAYYLISSIDPAYRASGSATYLIKQALLHLQGKTASFDFEGSMMEGVENSFRQFGTIQKPYFSIRKIPSRLLRLQQFAREFTRVAA